jgi:hypothetical protein
VYVCVMLLHMFDIAIDVDKGVATATDIYMDYLRIRTRIRLLLVMRICLLIHMVFIRSLL